MEDNSIQITLCFEDVTYDNLVEQIAPNIFRMLENDILDERLTYGTEFETQTNEEGVHRIVNILKESDYVVYRLWLSSQIPIEAYRLIGDEIMKHGGYWQVDMGSIASANLPRDCEFDLDAALKMVYEAYGKDR
ncbi:hypothetical protein [Taibaiella soli]|uniref:DUF4265 domain-containing protein n=1 Tax=Taibaiella soli TaxID=1649169 RepID=A0A2W2AUI1_9BACT|nr:hypothetical protein [Taibaiella soli]PZF71634.1 hypothetical protein DN068_16310 [Taibaiella soli]